MIIAHISCRPTVYVKRIIYRTAVEMLKIFSATNMVLTNYMISKQSRTAEVMAYDASGLSIYVKSLKNNGMMTAH